MSRAGTLILLGALTVLMPFSGLPSSARAFFIVVFGACVLGIGINMRSREAKQAMTPRLHDRQAGVEPTPSQPQEISPI